MKSKASFTIYLDLYVHLVDSREVTESHEKLYLTCMVLDVLNFQTPQDSSSAQTFNGTCKVLDETEVQAFILENVDLNDDDDSNLDNILKALSQIGGGFRVRAFKLYSTDFGIPQRRCRLFFIGFSEKSQGEASMAKVEQMLRGFRLKRQTPDTCQTGGGQRSTFKNFKKSFSGGVICEPCRAIVDLIRLFFSLPLSFGLLQLTLLFYLLYTS